MILGVQAAVKATMEQARTDKVMGSSLQCSVHLTVDDSSVSKVLERYLDELEAIFVVSSVELNQAVPESQAWAYKQEFEVQGAKIQVHVLPPKQDKCTRCWRYVAPSEDDLCHRCEEVVGPAAVAAAAA